MYTTRTVIKYTLLALSVIVLTSCFSEDNFLTDNLEETGLSYPNITDISIENSQDEYVEGESIIFDVRFWSEDPVSEILLYHEIVDNNGNVIQTLEEVVSVPYSEATFSEDSQTDRVDILYEVPEVTSSPSSIRFIIEVVNENGLSENNTESKNPTIRNIQVTAVQ